MLKIGFITCADLSRYFVSPDNPLLTHDDQLAFDELTARGCHVDTVVWGTSVSKVKAQEFDLLIVRSPWDYFDSDDNRRNFLDWLKALKDSGIHVANNYDVLKWSLDKHYLRELEHSGVNIVATEYLEANESTQKIEESLLQYGSVVVKPCIGAAAKDAFLIRSFGELKTFINEFESLRGDRAFMVQPFIREIASEGEWSLVFLDEQYSHAVLKKPKSGGWLVQDELGGSVQSEEPPKEVREFAQDAFQKLTTLLQNKFGSDSSLLYARVDILPGLRVGELELAEPELFFLDRKNNKANESALSKFHEGIVRMCT